MNTHKNAKLTPLGRERRVKMMLDGHTSAKAATLAGVVPRHGQEMAGAFAYRNVGGRCGASTGRAASGTGRRDKSRMDLFRAPLSAEDQGVIKHILDSGQPVSPVPFPPGLDQFSGHIAGNLDCLADGASLGD